MVMHDAAIAAEGHVHKRAWLQLHLAKRVAVHKSIGLELALACVQDGLHAYAPARVLA
jgi:hypothetical protein